MKSIYNVNFLTYKINFGEINIYDLNFVYSIYSKNTRIRALLQYQAEYYQ